MSLMDTIQQKISTQASSVYVTGSPVSGDVVSRVWPDVTNEIRGTSVVDWPSA